MRNKISLNKKLKTLILFKTSCKHTTSHYQVQFGDRYKPPKDVWEEGRSIRQATLKFIMKIEVFEGTPVREHMIKMVGFFSEMKILGVNIDGETKIDIVLETSPPSFN